MSEYTEVEQPFLAQLAAQGWNVIDQGSDIPTITGSAPGFHYFFFAPFRLHCLCSFDTLPIPVCFAIHATVIVV